jgi:hypothetical protein
MSTAYYIVDQFGLPGRHLGTGGVAGSRFTWRVGSRGLGNSIDAIKQRLTSVPNLQVIDEYGQTMRADEWLSSLDAYAVHEAIDRDFG